MISSNTIQKPRGDSLPEVPQFTWGQLALFVLLPVTWWIVVLYFFVPLLMPGHTTADGELTGWVILSASSLCYLFEFGIALYIFRSEGYQLRFSALRERINWHWPRSWKAWGLIIALVVVGLSLTQILQPTTAAIASIFPPPDWFPASQHPFKPVNSIGDALPGVTFSGNYLFLLLFLFTGTMNVLGEDLYYRAALIPKLHGLFGKQAWLAGGLIFTIKHVYVWWRFVADATALGVIGGFIFGPLCSLPAIMLVHFLTNFGITWPLVLNAVLGGG
jgi:hypothetical protein